MFEMKILKAPTCENDSAMVSIDFNSILNLKYYISEDPYYRMKNFKFHVKDITSEGFQDFSMDRPSLRGMSKFIEGTIYTYACQGKNGMPYEKLLDTVRELLSISSRRAFVTMSDRLEDYKSSINGGIDVSCLTGIHYKEDKVSLFFRASDLRNEFVIDMVTIYDYFVGPVYPLQVQEKLEIEVFISSCQNYDFINKLKIIVNESVKS